MTTLSNDLRNVIQSHVRAAGPQQILAIASALCTDEVSLNGAGVSAPAPAKGLPRFTVSDETVQDNVTGLIWTRKNVGTKRLAWADAKKACSEAGEGGFDDWRLPTIQELLSIVDYSRTSPAIDTNAFECESNWYWSATPYSASPAGYAWLVSFAYGYSCWSVRTSEHYVRAVRAGQLIGTLV